MRTYRGMRVLEYFNLENPFGEKGSIMLPFSFELSDAYFFVHLIFKDPWSLIPSFASLVAIVKVIFVTGLNVAV